MSNHPSKTLTIYFILALILLIKPGFCATELTRLQKQARVYRTQGYELQKQGNLDAALTYYQKALTLDPGYVAAYNDAGVIFEAKGQPEEAGKMYLRAIEIEPGYPNSYSNLAFLYEQKKDYANALLCWMKRIELAVFLTDNLWVEAAKKHIEDIAPLYPEGFGRIRGRYEKLLQELEANKMLLEKAKLPESGVSGEEAQLKKKVEELKEQTRQVELEINKVSNIADKGAQGGASGQEKQKLAKAQAPQASKEETQLKKRVELLKDQIRQVRLQIKRESSIDYKSSLSGRAPALDTLKIQESDEETELKKKVEELKQQSLLLELEIKREPSVDYKDLPRKAPVFALKEQKPAKAQAPQRPSEEAEFEKKMIEASLDKQKSVKSQIKEPGLAASQGLEKASLITQDTSKDKEKQDNKTSALKYLARAKESFSQGQYVVALKEATVAGYLDPSNEEISTFVEKVRKALLQ